MDALDSALFNQAAPVPRGPSAGRRPAPPPAGPARLSSADGAQMARPGRASGSGEALRTADGYGGYGGYGSGARSPANASPLGVGPPGRRPNPTGSRSSMLIPPSGVSALHVLRGSPAAGQRGPVPTSGSPKPGSRASLLGPAGAPPGPSYSPQPFPNGRPGSGPPPLPSAIRVVTHTADARPVLGGVGDAARRESVRDSPGFRRDSGYEPGPHASYQGGPRRDSGYDPGPHSPYQAMSRRDSGYDPTPPSQPPPAAPPPAPTMRRDGPRPAGVASAGARPGGVAQSGVTYGYACDQNVRHRNYMEDEHCVARLDELRPGAVWFGLFDGHGGRTACELAVSQLHKTFVNEAEAGGIGTRQQVSEALRRSFLKLDRMLLPAGAIHCGSTAAVALYLPRETGPGADLFVANAGDSRAVLISGAVPGAPLRLSTDHLPSNEAETQRVIACGGAIINGRVGGSLAVTRALGDHALKAGPPACGVTADPAIVAREVGATDRFLILASDGLWDVLSEAQAQAHVLASGGGAGGLQAVAASLVRKAIEEGTRDNVSVLLVKLS